MKSKNLLLIIILSIIVSCDINLDSETPYYYLNSNFIPIDYNQEEKIISFNNNQNQDIVQFKIIKYWKYEQSSGNFVSTDYKYERLKIDIELLDLTNYPNKFNLIDISQGYSGDPDRMEIVVYIPHFYNNQFRRYTYRFFYPDEELSSLRVNNRLYEKIVILDEANDYFAFFDNSTINKVYYDLQYGIIGFDDTVNNIQYRIIN